MTLWPRGRALIWGRVLITAWVLFLRKYTRINTATELSLFYFVQIPLYLLKKGHDTFQIKK